MRERERVKMSKRAREQGEQGEKDVEEGRESEEKGQPRSRVELSSIIRRACRGGCLVSGCVLPGRAYIEMESGPRDKTTHPR